MFLKRGGGGGEEEDEKEAVFYVRVRKVIQWQSTCVTVQGPGFNSQAMRKKRRKIKERGWKEGTSE